jgi:hypothetical protein
MVDVKKKDRLDLDTEKRVGVPPKTEKVVPCGGESRDHQKKDCHVKGM